MKFGFEIQSEWPQLGGWGLPRRVVECLRSFAFRPACVVALPYRGSVVQDRRNALLYTVAGLCGAPRFKNQSHEKRNGERTAIERNGARLGGSLSRVSPCLQVFTSAVASAFAGVVPAYLRRPENCPLFTSRGQQT